MIILGRDVVSPDFTLGLGSAQTNGISIPLTSIPSGRVDIDIFIVQAPSGPSYYPGQTTFPIETYPEGYTR